MNRRKRARKAARKERNQRKKTALIAEGETFFEQSRSWYAEKWAEDAAHFDEQALYGWMASFLSGFTRVLEIGTGEGSGTIALCEGGAAVVSIDENPLCLDIAYQNLIGRGISTLVEKRGQIVVKPPAIAAEYDRITSAFPTKGALLIEGDVGNDLQLADWLKVVGPFDAIACWNIGTHFVRHRAVGGMEKYRLIVQNLVYALGSVILRSGGVLHVKVAAGAFCL